MLLRHAPQRHAEDALGLALRHELAVEVVELLLALPRESELGHRLAGRRDRRARRRKDAAVVRQAHRDLVALVRDAREVARAPAVQLVREPLQLGRGQRRLRPVDDALVAQRHEHLDARQQLVVADRRRVRHRIPLEGDSVARPSAAHHHDQRDRDGAAV